VGKDGKGEIILSGGAIGSPHILARSGIGHAEELNAVAPHMQIISNLPGVGKNLQDHLGVRFVYGCSCPTLNTTLVNWWQKLGVGIQYIV